MQKKTRIFLMSVLTMIIYATASGQASYPYPFNPEEGIVNASEKPFREEVCLNGNWRFMPVYGADTTRLRLPSTFNWAKTPIRIPSPWNVNSFAAGNGDNFVTFPSYPAKWNKAPIAWMKKEFVVPRSWEGKEVFLHFEAVAGKAVYYLNGRKIGEHFDIFFPYEMDITKLARPGSTNELLVGVASPKLYDEPGRYGRRTYVAGSFWGTTMRGIWQDVYVLARPSVYISNVFVRPDLRHHSLKVEVTVKNNGGSSRRLHLSAVVRPWRNLAGKSINEAPVQKGVLGSPVLYLQKAFPLDIAAGDSAHVTLSRDISGQLACWTPDTPNLYGLVLSLEQGGRRIDNKYTRFGWRQFSIDKDHLLLNGKVIHLKGDSWHFMGVPEMTRRYAWAWFKVLKDAHANAVRLHGQPYPRFFLDVADEMGICVLDESGIWASDGGPKMDSPEFWTACHAHIKHLVMRDRNHPAVFGWSVSNETIPVAVNVFHAPDTIVHHLLHEINGWVALVRKLDPTREWISGDGETGFDRQLDFPVIVGHYGGQTGMRHWSEQGKPWGIGEQGMAYYGTPVQVSEFNGDRAYMSQEGRMEGLGIQAYQLIGAQRRMGASYSSIFNIVWYGLKPLALGLKDLSRAPRLSDGVFFTDFKEGVPGMQPERLGPYTSTLNPGYDPSLPLYEPWPLFTAVKAANADPVQPFSISPDSAAVPASLAGFTPAKRTVLWFGPEDSPLFARLKSLGLELSAQTHDPARTLVLIDGKTPPSEAASRARISRIVAAGGIAFVMGVSPSSLARLNSVLPDSLALTGREATSFIKKQDVPVLSGLGNGDFYFTELRRQHAMTHGLSGAFVRKGSTFLDACNTDWSRWNYRPEYAKTAAVLESEREKKPAGAALVSDSFRKGRYLVASLQFDSLKDDANGLLVQLLSNLGATFSASAAKDMTVLTTQGFLHAALIAGPFYGRRMSASQAAGHDFLGGESAADPQPGEQSGGKYWEIRQAGGNQVFELEGSPEREGRPAAVSYLSFWIYSPRSLVNLLVEPDMPSLDLTMVAGEGSRAMLNGGWLSASSGGGHLTITHVPLTKGWNHFLIKVAGGPLPFKARFHSDHADFIPSLKSSVAN